jgi:RNA polymerase sigma-70 factor (ECF subfamily)
MELLKFSDQELISAYLSGKEFYMSELIRRHESRLMSYIYVSVKDMEIAEDIFQDTFMKVIHKLKEGGYKEEGKFIQWILRIAHNLIIDHFRRNSRAQMVRSTEEYDIFNQLPVYDRNIEDEMITAQSHEKIKLMIELLPENQREVLKMRHYQELSFKEIAELTNVSINTALGRMRYAVLNLRKMMEENDIMLSA